MSLRRTVFEIFDLTLKPELESFKVIRIDTDRYAAYDFLLTFHSNQGPISYRFRDKQRFQSKIATFSHPVYFFAPPLISVGAGGQGRSPPGYGLGRSILLPPPSFWCLTLMLGMFTLWVMLSVILLGNPRSQRGSVFSSYLLVGISPNDLSSSPQ